MGIMARDRRLMSSTRITHELQKLQNGQQVSLAQYRLMKHLRPWLEQKLRTRFGNQARLDLDDAAGDALHIALEMVRMVDEDRRFDIIPREERERGSPREDFCRLLWSIARRKVSNQRRAANACKRKREIREADLAERGTGDSGEGEGFLEQVAGGGLTPGEVVARLEECDRLLSMLPEKLRPLPTWRLEGWSNEEIADKVKRVPETVERYFNQIRSIWENEAR
jgi:hypothetical protein